MAYKNNHNQSVHVKPVVNDSNDSNDSFMNILYLLIIQSSKTKLITLHCHILCTLFSPIIIIIIIIINYHHPHLWMNESTSTSKVYHPTDNNYAVLLKKLSTLYFSIEIWYYYMQCNIVTSNLCSKMIRQEWNKKWKMSQLIENSKCLKNKNQPIAHIIFLDWL